jgi:protein-S-isoprenylcysteine O-methyltransferase Ste14
MIPAVPAREGKMKKVLPTTYLFAALILMAVLHFLVPARRLIAGLWRILGVLPLALGVYIDLVADRAFKVRETTVKPFEKSSALLTDGVFSFSRHPMYLGMVLILAGLAVLAGSLTPWSAVLAFGILMDRFFIPVEESMMEGTFGDEYEAYRNRVRRWI